MAFNDRYSIYRDVLKLVGRHPNAGANVRLIGHVNGYWVVERLDKCACFEVCADELAYVPHEWRDAARRYDPQRVMTHFEGPGDVNEWHRFSDTCQEFPPDYNETMAFWGDRTFRYIFDASRSHTYSKKRGANNRFWDPQSKIFGGVVWSNCNPQTDMQSITSKEAPADGFQWWPCIFSIAPDGLVYMKCQDFAFTGGRPRPCDISRLVPYIQLAAPVRLSPVPEELSILNSNFILQMNPSEFSGVYPDGATDTASTVSGTDESIDTSSRTSWSTVATTNSVLSIRSSSTSSSFSWQMLPSLLSTSASSSSWAHLTSPTDSEVNEEDYVVIEV